MEDLNSLFDRAVSLHEQNQLPAAAEIYSKILARDPGQLPARNCLGILRFQEGRHEEALAAFDMVQRARPDFLDLSYNRGTALAALGRAAEALDCFDKVLETDRTIDALYNKAVALLRLDRFAQSLACFDEVLGIDPGFAPAWNNRGSALRQLGREEDALKDFGKALALNSNYVEAKQNLAICLCEAGHTDKGLALFRELAPTLQRRHAANSAHPVMTRHKAEQAEYKRHNGVHTAGEALPGPVVAPDLLDASARWQSARPQIVVIDDFLAPEALNALRNFCLGAEIWDTAFPEGYLGAFPEHGFCCPLLAQISGELVARYPAIFGKDALRYLWAFKYDRAHSGIKVHADFAKVNVNFWITPDEANLDPESGGLVIWDLAAPADWNFGRYNGEAEPIRKLLARHGAKSTRIPYRANRAVIFDSDLFHQTDEMNFKLGYENRRINVTMLYGKRS